MLKYMTVTCESRISGCPEMRPIFGIYRLLALHTRTPLVWSGLFPSRVPCSGTPGSPLPIHPSLSLSLSIFHCSFSFPAAIGW